MSIDHKRSHDRLVFLVTVAALTLLVAGGCNDARDATREDAAGMDGGSLDASAADASAADTGTTDSGSAMDGGETDVEPTTCGEPNPAGCMSDDDCADALCLPAPAGQCLPSSCWCEDDGTWACTEDCAGGVCGSPGEGCEEDGDCAAPLVCEDNTCSEIACPEIYAPVCGADGVTYSNDCEARMAHIEVAFDGPCAVACDDDGGCTFGAEWCEDGVCLPCPDFDCAACPRGFETVDRNGCFTCTCAPAPECDDERACPPDSICVGVGRCTDACIDNDPSCCESAICEPVPVDACGPSPAGCVETGCSDGFVCDLEVGCAPSSCFCDPAVGAWACTDDCGGGTCVPREGGCDDDRDCPVGEVCSTGVCDVIGCTDIYAPVCGVDGTTYPNECTARVAHADVAYTGECRDDICNSNEDCTDGLICHRRSRMCEPRCDTFTCFVPDPACGEDGRTYPCGEVEAWCNGVEIAFDGPCGDSP